MKSYRAVALIILDGWGIREFEHGNAVAQAQTPNFHSWLRTHERAIVDASGGAVGLPDGQMGNSEVGHLNLGAGRVVYQDIVRIDRAIRDNALGEIPILAESLAAVKNAGANLHLISLMGSGGVHSHSRHLYALLDLAREHGVQPLIHAITDGRDTPPNSAQGFIAAAEKAMAERQTGRIASLMGRYYAMDRDKRWDRTRQAYNAIAFHEGRRAESASAALQQAYSNGETDEFIKPFVMGEAAGQTVEPGDYLFFVNFRADRMRQLVKMFANYDLSGYPLDKPIGDLHLLTMTQYEEGLPVDVIFDKVNVRRPLAQVISEAGLSQFHAAETEKYAHVTYFFNGGNEQPFPGEEHLLVNSPKVATYDLQPEMSAHELAEKVEAHIRSHDDAFILVNFANPDMVGHTGDLAAAIKAVETTDECAARLVHAVNDKGGVAIVTADHGNCEIMEDEITGDPHTYHTTNPVSLFVIGADYVQLRPRGILADVAPTVLHLLGIEQPPEMTGESLVGAIK